MNMKAYEDAKIEIISTSVIDIIKTSGENDLDKADKSAGGTDWKW